jgi:hypothetical protein
MSAAASAAAAAQAIASAIKASGAIVEIEPRDFEQLVRRVPDTIVLHQEPAGMFSRDHRYTTSLGGFIFVARTREAIFEPGQIRAIPVKKIWFPD